MNPLPASLLRDVAWSFHRKRYDDRAALEAELLEWQDGDAAREAALAVVDVRRGRRYGV